MGPVCPFKAFRNSPDLASKILIVASQLPVSTKVPSGEKQQKVTHTSCPLNTWTSSPVLASHIRTLQSQPEETTQSPEKSQLYTRSLWPVKVFSSCPVAVVHNLSVGSLELHAERQESELSNALSTQVNPHLLRMLPPSGEKQQQCTFEWHGMTITDAPLFTQNTRIVMSIAPLSTLEPQREKQAEKIVPK